MSFSSALPLLTANALTTDAWRDLVSAWRETPYVPNYAYRLSHLYRHAGRKEIAQELVQIAFRLDHDRPDSVWLRAQERIRLGDCGGWKEYQTRWSDPAFLAGHDYQRWFGHRVMWDGVEDLSGKSLLVVQEQGMGDCLQMLRYLKVVRPRCAKLYAFVHPSLYRLTEACYGDILEHWDATLVRDPKDLPETDRHIGIMSLPGILGPLPRNAMRLPLPQQAIITNTPSGTGLAWRGNPKNLNDANRSMPKEAGLLLLARLRRGFAPIEIGKQRFDAWREYGPFKSFQVGDGEDWLDEEGVRRVLTPGGDWLATAQELQRVERLVTIDSAVMHLAGSLGVETWGLLCYAHDWRYPETGDVDEWYPNLRLIRQEKPGDWDSCIRSLLDRMASERHTIGHETTLRPPTGTVGL